MAQAVNRLRKYKFTGIVGIAEIVVTSLNVILRLRVMCFTECFQSPKLTSSWCVVVLRGFTGKV